MNEFNCGRFLNRALRSIVQAQMDEYQEVYTAKIAKEQAIAINQVELKRRRLLRLELMLMSLVWLVLVLVTGVGFIAIAHDTLSTPRDCSFIASCGRGIQVYPSSRR